MIPPMVGKKVLIIDDEFDFTELIETLLKFHDLDARACNDPSEAIKRLEQEHFDLVVSDLMMPDLDGFVLIEKMRGVTGYRDAPIIVLSAKMLTDQERKFLLKNKVHFLTKPFDPQVLVDQVLQALR